MRLNKYLAHRGVDSRRKCDEHVQRGRVQVNGTVVLDPALDVDPERDQVRFEGESQQLEDHVYYRYHKPPGQATTLEDPKIDWTLQDVVERCSGRVYPVGRLDQESRGLLLLTNDGDLAHRVSHPRHGVEKTYRVELDESPSASVLKIIRENGVHLEGRRTQPASVERLEPRVFRIVLREGRNRQIRRMFDKFGYAVEDLLRTRIGPLTLEGLEPGELAALGESRVETLRKDVYES